MSGSLDAEAADTVVVTEDEDAMSGAGVLVCTTLECAACCTVRKKDCLLYVYRTDLCHTEANHRLVA